MIIYTLLKEKDLTNGMDLVTTETWINTRNTNELVHQTLRSLPNLFLVLPWGFRRKAFPTGDKLEQ